MKMSTDPKKRRTEFEQAEEEEKVEPRRQRLVDQVLNEPVHKGEFELEEFDYARFYSRLGDAGSASCFTDADACIGVVDELRSRACTHLEGCAEAVRNEIVSLIAELYSKWFIVEQSSSTTMVINKLNELVEALARASILVKLAIGMAVMSHTKGEETGSLIRLPWMDDLRRIFSIQEEDKFYVLNHAIELAARAVDLDGFFQVLDARDASIPLQTLTSLERLLIISVDQIIRLDEKHEDSLGKTTDVGLALRLVFRCVLLAKNHPDMRNSEAFRLAGVLDRVVERMKQQADFKPLQSIAADLSPLPTKSFDKSPQNALFQVVSQFAPLVISPGVALSGDVKGWIPFAQSLIDNTRYDANRVFCEHLMQMVEKEGANKKRKEDEAAIRFVMAENQRMQLYMDMINNKRAQSSIKIEDVEQLYRLGMSLVGDTSSSSPQADLTRASLALGFARLLMEEGKLDEAMVWQRQAQELRERTLGVDDPLSVQAVYARAELLQKRAAVTFRDHPEQYEEVCKVLKQAMDILDEVEPKWRAASKYAYVATLREKRAETLELWSQIELAQAQRETHHTIKVELGLSAKSKLQEAITNIQRCSSARLDIYGPEHLRYLRAKKYAEVLMDEFDALQQSENPPSSSSLRA